MITLTKWGLRRKTDGFYMPQPKGRNGRGGSYMEPQDPKAIGFEPRLFSSPQAAHNALIAWLKGEYYKEVNNTGIPWDFGDETEETIKIRPKPDRKRSDMEIVSIPINLP